MNYSRSLAPFTLPSFLIDCGSMAHKVLFLITYIY